jgi:hypothetical protein
MAEKTGADFLEADDIGVELQENVGDASRVVAAVGADAAMDVVGSDADANGIVGEGVRCRCYMRSPFSGVAPTAPLS